MTAEAAEAVSACDVIVGYTVYVELIRTSWPEKDFFTTPMRQEIARCRKCYELAERAKLWDWCAAEMRGFTEWRRPCWSCSGNTPKRK